MAINSLGGRRIRDSAGLGLDKKAQSVSEASFHEGLLVSKGNRPEDSIPEWSLGSLLADRIEFEMTGRVGQSHPCNLALHLHCGATYGLAGLYQRTLDHLTNK
jgi:hypothetical protein